MAKRKKQILSTQSAVVAALGGISSVARLVRRRPPQVHHWVNGRKSFPARFYPMMRKQLRANGYDAPQALWDFEPEQNSAAA
jgi:DNA-binding transcriptional regulator YdaS (Cro superfamily)